MIKKWNIFLREYDGSTVERYPAKPDRFVLARVWKNTYSRWHAANGWSSDYFANCAEYWKKGLAKKKIINDFAKCLLRCDHAE